MTLFACPECGKSISNEAVACPSCGHPVKPPPVPAKKTGLWWGLGCLLAVPALLTVIAIIGLLASIAIPSFMKARETSQLHACVNNMRQIDSAKEAWALAVNADKDAKTDRDAVNAYLKRPAPPTCPAGGTYTYGPVGNPPECSKHGVLGSMSPSKDSSRLKNP